ncbi:MAG: group 1 truncated hemoglobin [Acidimicrobiales bacterium]|nr:group 1 truncated hemoglobin [Acidimicrobiales bacterium]
MNDTPDLLAAIGGERALEEIVEQFYTRLVADPDLGPVFAGVDVARLVHMQEEFLGVAFGSTDHVADADLRAAHARQAITGRQFSRFVELFCDTLAERDLPRSTVDRVADRLALYVDDVVGQYGDAG